MRSSAFPEVATTTETAWLDWAANLPQLSLTLDVCRAVIVAPHPDDETLGCGGLVADLRRAGVRVMVVAVTDGERSHPCEPTLRARRRAEQERALACLGACSAVVRLGFEDSNLGSHVERLGEELRRLLRSDDVVFAPWSHDGHSDHDACGDAAARTATGMGCRLLAYPVWAWQWASPIDLAGVDWRVRPLSGSAHAAKLAAIAEHRTQISDLVGDVIVDGEMLVRFRRDFEVFADVG